MRITLLFLASCITIFANSQTDIFTTDFQTGIPVNYSIVDNDVLTPDSQVANFTNAWIALQDPENSLDTVAGSTSFFSPVGTASRWLITPAINLGAYGNFIEWEAKSHDASYPDDYMILISTTDTQIASFTDTIGKVIGENFEWTNRQINISTQGYNNQTVYIAFVNNTEDGFILYLDDIHVWKNDPVGISELTLSSDVNVYPNPTVDFVKVETSATIVQLELLSINGDKLLISSTDQLSILSQPVGVYFVKVITDKGIAVKRIIKI
ncbi:MAG: hypothetical protein RI922_987 [Bacteroidota bacterium]|jgi:hypothetical protein